MANEVQNLAFFSAARPRDQVKKDRAYPFTFRAYASGTQQTITSATITILQPGGGALPTAVSGAAMTISSNDMTYSLVAGNAGVLGANYSAAIAYVVSGTTYDGFALFDVVNYPLRNVVVQSDLLIHYPDLTDILFGSTYSETTFAAQIAQGFEDVYQFVESKGKRPYLILSSEDLRRPIEHRALHLIFTSRGKKDSIWAERAQYHDEAFKRWLETASFAYDADNSGTISGGDNTGTGGEADRPLAQISWRL